MDKIDSEMLAELQKNGKSRTSQISKKLGIPQSTAHLRQKNLQQ